MSDKHDHDNLEQVAQDLGRAIEATEAVNWRAVPQVSVADVSKWCQKLQYARNCALDELESGHDQAHTEP